MVEMISTTVKTLLNDTTGKIVSHDKRHCVFVVREEATIFGVGQGEPRRRLLEHLGIQGQWPSQLGKLILNNLPLSMMWSVEIWDVAECEPLASTDKPLDEETARAALVAYYRPSLNIAHNPDPTPLPENYKLSLIRNSPKLDVDAMLRLEG